MNKDVPDFWFKMQLFIPNSALVHVYSVRVLVLANLIENINQF